MTTADKAVKELTEDPLLNLSQGGQILGGRCGGTVKRWIDDGLLPFVRLPGGRIAVRKSVCESFLGISNYTKKE